MKSVAILSEFWDHNSVYNNFFDYEQTMPNYLGLSYDLSDGFLIQGRRNCFSPGQTYS